MSAVEISFKLSEEQQYNLYKARLMLQLFGDLCDAAVMSSQVNVNIEGLAVFLDVTAQLIPTRFNESG